MLLARAEVSNISKLILTVEQMIVHCMNLRNIILTTTERQKFLRDFLLIPPGDDLSVMLAGVEVSDQTTERLESAHLNLHGVMLALIEYTLRCCTLQLKEASDEQIRSVNEVRTSLLPAWVSALRLLTFFCWCCFSALLDAVCTDCLQAED